MSWGKGASWRPKVKALWMDMVSERARKHGLVGVSPHQARKIVKRRKAVAKAAKVKS